MLSSIVIACCVAVAILLLVYFAMLHLGGVRAGLALKLAVAGAAIAVPVVLLTSYVIDSLGWASGANRIGAWAPTVLVVAPVEQAALVIVVWPVYRAHRLLRIGTAVSAGLLGAAGFGVVQLVEHTISTASAGAMLPILAVLSIRALAAASWATVLSTTRARYRHLFPLAWLAATAVDGCVRYLQRTGGFVWQVLTLVLLIALLGGSYLIGTRFAGQRAAINAIRQSRLGMLANPQGIGTVRASWQHAHRPALLHWIVGGAFVSFGANIVGLGLGIALAHGLHIDLSRVDESNVGAMVPLLLLSLAVLISYPVAAYLTAKASGADSVFEPGVAALISIVALTILLSMTAPVTIILAIVLAPVAFGLSCLGAWLGISANSAPDDA
jgi:hypothetical protein